jgi:hypothetical protein
MRKRRTDREELNALDVIEQAVHLLRRAPGTLLIYCAGSLPFILGVLFFCSDMSRSAFAEDHLVGGAAGLAALFIWMKTWQVIFANRLRAQLAEETPQALNPKTILSIAAQQTLIQPLALVLMPVAGLILLPMGWTIAFFKNATVLGADHPDATLTLLRRSWREASLEPMQNHGALGILFIFALFVFLNLAVTLLTVPWLLKTLFGIETAFTLSVASVMNTTFFATIFGLTYLCLDPILTAFTCCAASTANRVRPAKICVSLCEASAHGNSRFSRCLPQSGSAASIHSLPARRPPQRLRTIREPIATRPLH